MKWFILLALLFLLLSLPYLSFPPDDDVGGHLVAARGLLEGKKLYSDYLDNKGPMLYLSLVPAVILAGKSVAALRIIALAVSALAAFLTYLSVGKLCGEKTAILASAIFFLLALDPFTEAFELRSELFIALSISAMAYCATFSGERGRQYLWAGAGLSLGYAILIKPSTGILILPLLYLVPKKREPLLFLSGGTLASLCAFLLLVLSGLFNFGDYLQVSILKPSAIAAQLAGPFPFVLVLAGLLTFPPGIASIASSLFFLSSIRNPDRGTRVFGALFLPLFAALLLWVLSAVGVYNALMLMFLPLLSAALAMALSRLASLIEAGGQGMEPIILSPSVFALAFALVMVAPLLSSAWLQGPVPGQNTEGTDLTRGEFEGAVSFIESNTEKNDTVLVYELMPVFYYYSGREPASPALWFAPVSGNLSYYDDGELETLLLSRLRMKMPKYVIVDPEGAKDGWFMDALSETYLPDAEIGRFKIYSRRA